MGKTLKEERRKKKEERRKKKEERRKEKRMKPWELLYHFYRLGKSKHFTLEEQAMYSQLVWLAWESGKWNGLQVTNNRMKDFIGKKDDRAIEKPRNSLIQLGLIKYSKGKKGSPSKYTLLPVAPLFVSAGEDENTEEKGAGRREGKYTVKTPPQVAAQAVTKPVAHIKKRERKGEEKPLHPLYLKNLSVCKPSPDEKKLKEVAAFFSQCKGSKGTPFDEKKMKEWLEKGISKETLFYAFEESALRDRFHWGYINQVIENKEAIQHKGGENHEFTRIAQSGTRARGGGNSKDESFYPLTTTRL